MELLLLFVAGSVAGSFLGALTWRAPRNISIAAGRSFCPHCKHAIRWFDNIPIVSYIVLGGKCRDCKAAIPRRDWFIELAIALSFPVIYLAQNSLTQNITWLYGVNGLVQLAILLFLLLLSAGIFIIDIEHQYIPDTMVFVMLAIVILSMLGFSSPQLFVHIASGLGAAVFLLLIHLATLGRGMGLGDVKLVLALGMVLGFPLTVVFMFLAFSIGSIVGLVFIILGKAKLKQKIAFGPFLILGFWLAAIYGNNFLTIFYI